MIVYLTNSPRGQYKVDGKRIPVSYEWIVDRENRYL